MQESIRNFFRTFAKYGLVFIGGAGITFLLVLFGFIPSCISIGPFELCYSGSQGRTTNEEIIVRVADRTGASISGVNVIFLVEGGPFSQHTDSYGFAKFSTDVPVGTEARVIVEPDNPYNVFIQNITVPEGNPYEIRLEERSDELGNVVVHVVRNEDNLPVPGAIVSLVVRGTTYRKGTDSFGIATLTIPFSIDEVVEGFMSVQTPEFKVVDQNVALLPNKVYDVRLNSAAAQIMVGNVETSSAPTNGFSEPPVPEIIPFDKTLRRAIASPLQVGRFTFAAEANDIIIIRWNPLAPDLCLTAELKSPEGESLYTESCFMSDNERQVIVPSTGIYLVAIKDSGSSTGLYELYVNRLNP